MKNFFVEHKYFLCDKCCIGDVQCLHDKIFTELCPYVWKGAIQEFVGSIKKSNSCVAWRHFLLCICHSITNILKVKASTVYDCFFLWHDSALFQSIDTRFRQKNLCNDRLVKCKVRYACFVAYVFLYALFCIRPNT